MLIMCNGGMSSFSLCTTTDRFNISCDNINDKLIKMDIPEIFLNKRQKEIDNHISNWGVGYTADVMMDFAKQYHKQQLILNGVGYSLPSKEAKESKKIQLVNYIQKNLNPKVNRTDFRSGFEYCYIWINGELNI